MYIIELLRIVLELGPFKPGFYLYCGLFEYDRDTQISGWRGPFKSRAAAKNNVSRDWVAFGLDDPKVKFRLFQPCECSEPLEEKWTVASRSD